jgi:hypothetical protein
VKAEDGYLVCGGMYQLKDPSLNSQQFHQEYIGLPEDGAPNAPKHVGARLYTNIRLCECVLLVFHSPYEK